MKRPFNPLVPTKLPWVTSYLVSCGVKGLAGFPWILSIFSSPVKWPLLPVLVITVSLGPLALWTQSWETESSRGSSSGWTALEPAKFLSPLLGPKDIRQLELGARRPRRALGQIQAGCRDTWSEVSGPLLGLATPRACAHPALCRAHDLLCSLATRAPFTKSSACVCLGWPAPPQFASMALLLPATPQTSSNMKPWLFGSHVAKQDWCIGTAWLWIGY